MRSTRAAPRLHHDPLSARTVIVAPQRADRPQEVAGAAIRCPFCAGNESLTPPDLLRCPASPADPWRARIVPNKFPAVVAADSQAPPAGWPEPTGDWQRPARGVHDVVIESPEHVASVLAIEPAAWGDVWDLCRRRLEELSLRGEIAWSTVFKNSGGPAGASLEHVHSQIMALDFVPPTLRAELAASAVAGDPFGDLLRAAEADDRVVDGAGDLLAIVPPAPRQPFETWILPRGPEPHFHATSRARVDALAALTWSLVRRLESLVPRLAYNWWLHQAPQPPYAPAPSSWHWHLEVLPRINGLAGFELGAGCHITTMAPREAADRLRRA